MVPPLCDNLFFLFFLEFFEEFVLDLRLIGTVCICLDIVTCDGTAGGGVGYDSGVCVNSSSGGGGGNGGNVGNGGKWGKWGNGGIEVMIEKGN